ncbi:MAG TPA: hypothetical protein RMH26_24445, partial [Polyangiaceae bacterium LLY-WYZ-15_(1-7)]|nr:hypothetical protein [Polyangiaceae bacterium LLY-WYZ-15_(1-7)]
DPTDRHALRELEHVLGRGILPTVARVSDLRGALEQAYPGVAPRPPSVTPLQLVRRKDEDLSASSPRERAPTNPEGDEVVLPLVRTKSFPTPAGGARRPAPPKPAGAPVQKTFKRPKASEPPPPPPPSPPSPPPRAPGTADYVRPPDAPEEPATSTGRRSIIPPHEASWGDLVPPPSSSAPPRAASSPAPASAHELGASLAAIRASQDRDGIVRHACEGALTVARSAVFLAVRKGVLRGWDGLGAGVSADAIRNLWIPTTSPSMFQRVVDEAEPHVGRFGSSAADNLYRAATGSRGGHVVLQPVVVGGRVVGVLCADDARGTTAPERIETLAHAVSDAFKALIVRKKR